MGLKWEAFPLLASLGGKGFMVDRMRARQSATFLLGAQARAGVWPADGQQGKSEPTVSFYAWQEVPGCFIIIIPAYLPHPQPWLLLLCSVTPALQSPGLSLLQCEGACKRDKLQKRFRHINHNLLKYQTYHFYSIIKNNNYMRCDEQKCII